MESKSIKMFARFNYFLSRVYEMTLFFIIFVFLKSNEYVTLQNRERLSVVWKNISKGEHLIPFYCENSSLAPLKVP